jgi:hypothetical protein
VTVVPLSSQLETPCNHAPKQFPQHLDVEVAAYFF